jgi:hypothetical protein
MAPPVYDLYGRPYAACTDEPRRAQLAREAALPPLERILRALDLGRSAGLFASASPFRR